MNTIIKGTKTVEEFAEEKKRMEQLATLAFESHRNFFSEWKEGEPVKVWYDIDGNLCVEYQSGNWWHYKDLNLPFPTWW